MASTEQPSLREQVYRSSTVGIGMATDIALNYPLWIIAKRMGVGMPAVPSTLPELYKGGGSLWISLGPTTILEDFSKQSIEHHVLPASIPGGLGIDRELVSSVFAGAFSAALFCAQVEHAITASHAQNTSMSGAFRHIYEKRGGVKGLLVPPGILAMMFREMPFVAALFYVRPAVTARVYGGSSSSSTGNEANDVGTATPLKRRLHLELLCGLITSSMTSPVAHVPSVVAAYQQGHGVKLRQAVTDIYQQGGLRAFWRGLIARTLSIAGTMAVVPMVIDALGGDSCH